MNSLRYTKPRSVTIATFGASTSQHTLGTVLKPRLPQVHGLDIGTLNYCRSPPLAIEAITQDGDLETLHCFIRGVLRSWHHKCVVLFLRQSMPTTISARYLNDLWLFDTQEYRWQQVEFKPTDVKPSYVPKSEPYEPSPLILSDHGAGSLFSRALMESFCMASMNHLVLILPLTRSFRWILQGICQRKKTCRCHA